MKKCQHHLRSQHKVNTFKYRVNATPKIAKNPVNKIATYNHHFQEFYTANSNLSYSALNNACRRLAGNCGLKVSSIVSLKMGAF